MTISVHWEKGEQMGKPRMIGQFNPYTKNMKEDMRFRKKANLRNKERAKAGRQSARSKEDRLFQ